MVMLEVFPLYSISNMLTMLRLTDPYTIVIIIMIFFFFFFFFFFFVSKFDILLLYRRKMEEKKNFYNTVMSTRLDRAWATQSPKVITR